MKDVNLYKKVLSLLIIIVYSIVVIGCSSKQPMTNIQIEQLHRDVDAGKISQKEADNKRRAFYLDEAKKQHPELYSSEQSSSEESGGRKFFKVLSIVLLVGAIFTGVYFLTKNQSSSTIYVVPSKYPCDCPYHFASDGSRCGERSAYSKSGGRYPVCY